MDITLTEFSIYSSTSLREKIFVFCFSYLYKGGEKGVVGKPLTQSAVFSTASWKWFSLSGTLCFDVKLHESSVSCCRWCIWWWDKTENKDSASESGSVPWEMKLTDQEIKSDSWELCRGMETYELTFGYGFKQASRSPASYKMVS